jgi:AbrB family looped-hinge helix DNA binding protein
VAAEPRARMRQKGQITLPGEVREALRIDEGDEVQFTVTKDGQVTLRGFTSIPTDQRWFWTPEWQAGEREADADLAAGRFTRYHDVDEMLEDLGRRFPTK